MIIKCLNVQIKYKNDLKLESIIDISVVISALISSDKILQNVILMAGNYRRYTITVIQLSRCENIICIFVWMEQISKL
jgi:hypothetical protein